VDGDVSAVRRQVEGTLRRYWLIEHRIKSPRSLYSLVEVEFRSQIGHVCAVHLLFILQMNVFASKNTLYLLFGITVLF